MISDHKRDAQLLKDAAARSGLQPPIMNMSEDQSHLLSALQGQIGPNFDTTYVKQQRLAHESALITQRHYAAAGDDPSLKQIAVSAVTLIQSHIAMIDQMAIKLGSA